MNDYDKKAARDRYEHRGEFEHELLNRRVTWLLTSQTILFAAYGLSFNEKATGDQAKLFRESIPELGIILSLIIWIGINAAFISKILSLLDFRKSHPDFKNEPLGVRSWLTILGYFPDFFIPLVFVFVWSKL